MKPVKIKHIYIDADCAGEPLTEKVCRQLEGVPVTILPSSGSFPVNHNSIPGGKRILYLTRYKGVFSKPCPGTSEDYLCCNYYVINETTGCPLDCSYCILQSYLESPVLKIYVNYKKIFSEIEDILFRYPHRVLRIGTGELTDSLAIDHITGLSALLISFFNTRRNVLFELKTKTGILPRLVPGTRVDNIVLSWSLNPPGIIRDHEKQTASLEERLDAAVLAGERGYKLSFHFDPVIHHQGWRENYTDVIQRLFSRIDPSQIVWISIGGLRFHSDLRDVIRGRNPRSPLIRDEQIQGMDQKIRYFKPLRLRMFQHIYDEIRSVSADVFVYFCMEDKKIWEKTLGFAPINTNHVDYLFAESLYRRFPDLSFSKPDFDMYQSQFIKHDPERQRSV
jgi:spore photoproduct lyase